MTEHHGRRWPVAASAIITAVAILVTGGAFTSTAWSSEQNPQPQTAGSAAAAPTTDLVAVADLPKPPAPVAETVENVVFVLADDLDWATFRQVPRLAALQAQGQTYLNTISTDSLCCPSRTSILRSQYIHNHLVVSNREASGGGWPTFYVRGEENDCLPVWLHNAGVQTAFFGKYLNEYGEGKTGPTWVPPGWDRWFVPTTHRAMYRGYNYTINDNGTLVKYGSKPKDFLADVLTQKTVAFIKNATTPFYAQLNLTNPHDPAPVAKRHQDDARRVQVPRTSSYNATGIGEPSWRSSLGTLGTKRLKKLDRMWQQRVQSAESVADAVEAVQRALSSAGKLESTLIVLGSDNGFHAASRRLPAGKRTPYHEDTVVPYVFIGPGVTPSTTVDAMTSTIDLAPTFSSLLGTTTPEWVDGRSLVPFLVGQPPASWRTGILTESMSEPSPGDPDYETFKPPQFRALRTPQWLYVEYQDGTRELVNRLTDPAEQDNLITTADPITVSALERQLTALRTCAGETCRIADSLPN